MRLFNLKELEVRAETVAERDRSEIHRTKFVQKHLSRIESIKNLMGEYPCSGEAYFLWTLKSFNAFTFIVYVIKHVGPIDELFISTYSLNERILASLIRWYDKGEIKSVNLCISDSIRHRTIKVYDAIEMQRKSRNFNVTYCWNHSKIALMKSAGNSFVIEGSGNFSENAMHEQYLFLNDQAVYDFRRECLLSLATPVS